MTPAPSLPPNASEDRAPLMIGIIVMCLIISTTAVTARIWTRKFILDQMGWDDYLTIFTLLIIYGEGIAMAVNTKFGLGKHVGTFDPTLIPLYMRTFYVSIVLYTAALFFVKMVFLVQYYRVFFAHHMRNLYIGFVVIVACWGLSQVLVGIFICTPIAGFWDSTIKAKCIPNLPQWYTNAAGNIATDVAVFVLPLPIIRNLQLPKQQKVMLLGIFSLGFFTVAISVIRIRFLKLFDDFTWENVESSCWSITEITSAITCACLPTLRPLLSHYFPNTFPSASGSRTNYIRQPADLNHSDNKDQVHVSFREQQTGTSASTDSRESLNRTYELENRYPQYEVELQPGIQRPGRTHTGRTRGLM